METHPVGAESFHVGRWMDMMNFIFNFAVLLTHLKMETCTSTNHWEILKISSEHNSLCSVEIYTEYIQYKMSSYAGLFISPSGTSELDCATTKTDTAERSISIGRESKFFFCTRGLGVLAGSTARG